MASFNRVIMMGNLTRDPEHKQLASGQAVCRLGLASNRQFKNRQTGMMVQEVCFVDVDVWGPQAESCSKYLQKGRPVLIEGRLKLDSWTDNDGTRRSKHTIVADRVTFLGGAQAENSGDEMGGESVADSSTGDEMLASATQDTPKKARARVKPAVREHVAASNTDVAAGGTGEVEFKNDGPFEDDLPF